MRRHRGLLRSVDRQKARRRSETTHMWRPAPAVWVYPKILNAEIVETKQPALIVFTG